MKSHDVFTVSSRGRAELHGAASTLSSDQLALMVRFDGNLTWSEVRATVPAAQADAARAQAIRLYMSGLLERVEWDPLDSRIRADAELLAGPAGSRDFVDSAAPLRRRGFRAGIARRGAPRKIEDRRVQVVLVEDEPLLARFVHSLLTLNGFDVRVAGNREEIVRQVRRPPRPDLFLLDVGLPDIDGFSVLRTVRRHPVLHDVPVIMATGTSTREAVIRGLGEGADGYLTKPYDPDTLLQAVHSVLGFEAPAAAPASVPGWPSRDAVTRRATA